MRRVILFLAILIVSSTSVAQTKPATKNQSQNPRGTTSQRSSSEPTSGGSQQQNGQQGAKKGEVTSLRDVYALPPSCFTKQGNASTFQQRLRANEHCEPGSATIPPENAADVAKSFGNDPDFSVQAVGTDKIAIYLKSDSKLKGSELSARLQSIKDSAANLTKPPFQSAEIVAVPSGTATQLSQQLSSLKISGLTANPIGNDAILLKTDGTQGPIGMDYIKRRLAVFKWERPSAPPTQRLFEITTKDVMKGMGSSPDGGKSGGDSGSGDKSDSSDKSGGASATASPEITVTAIGQGGSDENSGDDSKDSDKSQSAATSKDTPKDSGSPKPLTMQAVTDNLIYTNATGGDENIAERTRLITMLDLPRPEVLMNLSTFQITSNRSDAVSRSSEILQEVVGRHNELLQRGIEDGWEYLSQQGNADENFFDLDFYQYITRQFTLDLPLGNSPAEAVGADLKLKPEFAQRRLAWGRCSVNQYCLGFAHAFEPPRPTLTNILLTLVAAAKGQEAAEETICRMQKGCFDLPKEAICEESEGCGRTSAFPEDKQEGDKTKRFEIGTDPKKDRRLGLTNHAIEKAVRISQCFAGEKKRILLNWPVPKNNKQLKEQDQAHRVDDCETRDRLALAEQVIDERTETLQLQCFAEQTQRSFAGDPDHHFATRVGLLRAAIADFLFNYKMAQQYPHDFITYDLNQSAQELNAEFNPLILAFNRDVAAFTQHLQTEINCRRNELEVGGWIGEDRNTFLNDGAITVRGISGVESIVDTLTQNFFDATQPPSITDLVKSVGDAEKNIPDVLKANLTSHEAAVIVGALNSVKPAEAKIGRQLKLDITPHALAGASSAELEVQLSNQESADPTRFTADGSKEDNLSRVARHNTTTRVRVESLKLFEVSSFSAMLQRPRSRIPIVPPLFEVPYFGSFLGLPRTGAKEYHRSTAIVSAIIVPTAADLAYGIDFSGDRICFGETEPPTREYGDPNSPHCYRAKSFADLQGLPFRNYHKAMVQCLATGGYSRYPATNLPQIRAQLKSLTSISAVTTPHCSFQFSNVPPPE